MSKGRRRRRRTRIAVILLQSSNRKKWVAWASNSFLCLHRKYCFLILLVLRHFCIIYRKKQTIDKDLIKKFKAVQENELRTWRGVNIKFTSRPGNTDPATLVPGQCHTQGGASGASGQAGWVGNNAAGGMGIGGSMGSAMGGANGGLMNAQNCQTISGPG